MPTPEGPSNPLLGPVLGLVIVVDNISLLLLGLGYFLAHECFALVALSGNNKILRDISKWKGGNSKE